MPNLNSQLPSKTGTEFLLNGFQLPNDKNNRRIYDALKILTNQVKDLIHLVQSIIGQQTISPLTNSNSLPGQNVLPDSLLEQQNTKRTVNYDILKRVSTRL